MIWFTLLGFGLTLHLQVYKHSVFPEPSSLICALQSMWYVQLVAFYVWILTSTKSPVPLLDIMQLPLHASALSHWLLLCTPVSFSRFLVLLLLVAPALFFSLSLPCAFALLFISVLCCLFANSPLLLFCCLFFLLVASFLLLFALDFVFLSLVCASFHFQPRLHVQYTWHHGNFGKSSSSHETKQVVVAGFGHEFQFYISLKQACLQEVASAIAEVRATGEAGAEEDNAGCRQQTLMLLRLAMYIFC